MVVSVDMVVELDMMAKEDAVEMMAKAEVAGL